MATELDTVLEIREHQTGSGLMAHLQDATDNLYYDITELAGKQWVISDLLNIANGNFIDVRGVEEDDVTPDEWASEWVVIAMLGYQYQSDHDDESEMVVILMTDRMVDDGKRLFGVSVR